MVSFSISGSYTDLYQITMGEAYFLEGRDGLPACFDYFFRKVPGKGGYVVFAGLEEVLDALTELRFTAEDIRFLQTLKLDGRYLEFLGRFRFQGAISAAREGEIVFPGCPIVRVEGSLLETQLVETLLLNILNFESLIATKASRMRCVAGNRSLSDFGLRRAQGPGGVLAARAAVIGGFDSTSNVYAGERYGIDVVGTMAHSFVESFESEIEAFRSFARTAPHNCVFLLDTYDTLQSGLPNAITVAREMASRGEQAAGIRLDSGDLAYLAREARLRLDAAGLSDMKIVVSNQLDEYVIKSLLDQGAPIDIFGVGTQLVTGQPDGALDGVYKLSFADGRPRLKLSESIQKVTLPGIKQVLRVMSPGGTFFGADAIVLEGEQDAARMYHPAEPGRSLSIADYAKETLLRRVMEGGRRLGPPARLLDIQAYSARRLGLLPAEYRRFENPHGYKVGISKRLLDLRDETRQQVHR